MFGISAPTVGKGVAFLLQSVMQGAGGGQKWSNLCYLIYEWPLEVIFYFSAIEIEFPADMRWFKANINGSGFYRVGYPRENWDALVNALIKDHKVFSVADRAQLINDAFSLSM